MLILLCGIHKMEAVSFNNRLCVQCQKYEAEIQRHQQEHDAEIRKRQQQYDTEIRELQHKYNTEIQAQQEEHDAATQTHLDLQAFLWRKIHRRKIHRM